ncbi:MAG: metal ABC transporter substrate-binding protein [Candidatus Tectimicrobiota bacterium]
MLRQKSPLLVLLACYCPVLLLGWSAPLQAAPLKVAATIFPLYDMLRQVAGAEAEVVLLVPPGASPHTFTVKPGTIRALTGCQAVFIIGHGFDDWVSRLARDAGVKRLMLTDKRLPLRRGYSERHEHQPHRSHTSQEGGVDPHYWLSVPNALLMVENIAASLGQLNPAEQAGYQRRASAYQEELRLTDAAIRQQLADLPRRDIATFHMAFAYFAETYGLNIVAVFEPTPGREPGPRYVEMFQRQIATHNLRTVFIEPQLSEAPLRGLSRDLGVTLQTLDPNGGSEALPTYIAMMQFNARQIAAALRQ